MRNLQPQRRYYNADAVALVNRLDGDVLAKFGYECGSAAPPANIARLR